MRLPESKAAVSTAKRWRIYLTRDQLVWSANA
jgi:hypothetical protein